MSDRKPLIAGNWKMHHTHLEAIQVVQKLSYGLDRTDYDRTDVVVCPSFTSLRSVQTTLESDRIPIALGAQDVFYEKDGAYTGEVSPIMLAKLNVSYVIVGHSERRQLFGDTDEIVNKKATAVIAAGMTPIICVGETLEQREAGDTTAIVQAQVEAAYRNLSATKAAATVVAYEPVWAIGTGRNATADDANTVAGQIREVLARVANDEVAAGLRILYGGSVKPGNIAEFMAQPEIDGALVGGASLDAVEFARIVRFGA
ncbi:MAG: triose-phosphate isomerase [Acidimicrobiia bacterium]